MATRLGYEIIDHMNVTSSGITVPAGTELAVVAAGGYDGSTSAITAMDINSDAFTIRDSSYAAGGIFTYLGTLVDPSTGAQTLSFTKTAMDEEGVMAIVYYDDLGATGFRDFAIATSTAAPTHSESVNSSADDSVEGFAFSYPAVNPTTNQTGQTTYEDNDTTGVSYILDLFEADSPGASTTTMQATCSYGGLIAWSIAGIAAAGGGPRLTTLLGTG